MLNINKIIGGLVLLFLSLQVNASIVLQTTRVIFPSDKKTVSIQATNFSEQSALMQSWVDEGNINSTPETSNAPFIVTPPVIKIAANEGTQLRIQFIGEGLPQDRESVFYLNVLDIAPKPENKVGANILQLALQTRIKLFYRPIELAKIPNTLINQVKVHSTGQLLTINNPTPYFLSISELYFEGNQASPIAKSFMIAPFSTHKVDNKSVTNANENIVIVYIDDTGSFINHKTKVER